MRRAAVTGCDAGFTVGAAAILRGVRRCHPDVDRYCLAPPADAAAVQAALGDLARVVPAPRAIRVAPPERQPGLLKLFAPLVPADVVVWLDSDMVFCRPAPELWDVRPGRVVAVLDMTGHILHTVDPTLRAAYQAQFPAAASERGLNGGLLGLRVAEWRDLPGRYEAAFEAGGYAHHPKIWDQPMLNGLMHGRVDYLPRPFNAHNTITFGVPADARIVHYTAAPKPWQPGYPRHEPGYYHWLRFGLGEERFRPLARAKFRIWARTPRRVVVRFLRARGLLPGPARA